MKIAKTHRLSLENFPTQTESFPDLSAPELEALADDISRNGLKQRIEILPKNKAKIPENTILDGHQRCKALKILGETEAAVIVRRDLAGADFFAINIAFLEANLNRRHLDPLSKARALLHIYENEKKRPRGELSDDEDGEARNRVGKLIGWSGRNLQRYWRVLQCPVEVQNALLAKEISLALASKAANLSSRQQTRVAQRIRAGEGAKEVIQEFLPEADAKTDSNHSLLRQLERIIDEPDRQIGKFHIDDVYDLRDLLRDARFTVEEFLLFNDDE